MLLTVTDIALTFPIALGIGIRQFVRVAAEALPYTSWDDIHHGFGAVVEVPASAWDVPGGLEIFALLCLGRWIVPASAFIFFG
jgi:hypothetical protein